MSKNAIATVFYPEAKNYIVDFLLSVKDQTMDDFVLIILNNGLKNINNYFKGIRITYIIEEIKLPAALARERLIKIALNQSIEKIIFADCDDIMHPDRLEISLEKLTYFDVVVNDVCLFNNNLNLDKYFSNSLSNLQNIDLNMLYEKNFMGLSNTAVKSEVLKMNLKPSNPYLKAYDWFLWSKILLKKKSTIFIDKPLTKYRIHGNNIAHLNKNFSELEVINGIKVKKNHYNEFRNVNNKYKYLCNSFDYIHSKIKDINWMSNYIKLVNNTKLAFPHWWENIIIPSKLRK